MPPGILWVSSRIADSDLEPESGSEVPVPKLTPEKFCAWYEDTHIQQVLDLSGVRGAGRWEGLGEMPPSTWSTQAPWLTVYEMPDIEYRNTKEFKALDGQSKPEEVLLKEVFEQARFDTRFYTLTQTYPSPPSPSASTSPTHLISAALHPNPHTTSPADFEAWYRDEHLRELSKCRGYIRTRRFELVHASTLDRFVRSEPKVGGEDDGEGKGEGGVARWLALHEFGGEELDWENIKKTTETPWSKKIMGYLVVEELGFYRIKRVYV